MGLPVLTWVDSFYGYGEKSVLINGVPMRWHMIKKLRNLLRYYYGTDETQGVMILLDGKWGSGKTFRWEHSISKELKNKEALYFSLFGILSAILDMKKYQIIGI